jgi:23S rRNA G2069 N7-methylase RlmK/C1962 C5-methylase RlmI
MLKARLKKNYARMKGELKSQKLEAFRLYEQDIPEIPLIIDLYGESAVIYRRDQEGLDDPKQIALYLTEAKDFLFQSFNIDSESIFVKDRVRQTDNGQYVKLARENMFTTISEFGLSYEINLSDYLDTGLFLDARMLRKFFLKNIKEGQSLLNLYAYTCSIGVCAASQGAQTVNVDMSHNYLEWGRRNYIQNELLAASHEFIEAPVEVYLEQARRLFDYIYLNPPIYSRSKKMEKDFDLDKDHKDLIFSAMKRLESEGLLLFVANKERFKLDPLIAESFKVEEVSENFLPFDMRKNRLHTYFIRR